jgi:hypothetical protein
MALKEATWTKKTLEATAAVETLKFGEHKFSIKKFGRTPVGVKRKPK